MKKIIITVALFLMGIAAFSQEETNGTIYIRHPYIDMVNKAVKSYVAGDFTALKMNYADTATYWQSGLEDFIPLKDAIKGWKENFEYFSDISMKPIGYPDYLHYKKGNDKIVQSWWTWSGKSKKSGETISIKMVIYDEFNAAGKFSRQYQFGDFSALKKEQM